MAETNTSSQLSTLLTETDEDLKKRPKAELAKEWCLLKKLLVQDNPFLLIEEGHLYIKTKPGELIRLILNKTQLKLHAIIKKLWDENKIINLIILKARQLGVSTYVEALLYAIISQGENQNAEIIADDKDNSNYIFEMSKLYQEKCPDYLRPEIKKSNEKKLEFDGNHSQILIDTAENPKAGRALTLRAVHLSEYGFFRKKNAGLIMIGLSHSLPPLPRTIRIKESTANGFNHFKDDWDAAVAGETDEVPIFIPWYWSDDYMMPVEGIFEVGDPAIGDNTKDEPELFRLMQEEGITQIEERLFWRRWDIRNNCKNSVDAFKQEMPSTPEEAFLASGRCFFNQKELVRQLALDTQPLYRANIVKENYKWVLRKCDDGDFAFFEEPTDYNQYCIGGDACSGSGTDYGPLVAINKETGDTVAIYHAKCDPDELAYRAMTLGSFLNNAKVGIENDKFGFAANRKLITLYGNVYVKRTYDKTSNKITESFGWDSNVATRAMALSQLQEEIREGTAQLRYKKLIKEGLTFIKNPETGKAEAESGENDDLIIARAIAGQLRTDEPYRVPTDRERRGVRPGVDTTTLHRNAGMKFGRKKR